MNRSIKHIMLIAGVSLSLVCCQAQTRYRLLHLFFDGVPDPNTVSLQPDSTVIRPSADDAPVPLAIDTTTVIQTFVHKVYRKDSCNYCHDLKNSYRLNTRQPDLCYACHKNYTHQYTYIHGPVAAGLCTACHHPHKSSYPALLKHPDREHCQYCHAPGDVARNSAHEKISQILCMDCHDPHGGNRIHFLKDSGE